MSGSICPGRGAVVGGGDYRNILAPPILGYRAFPGPTALASSQSITMRLSALAQPEPAGGDYITPRPPDGVQKGREWDKSRGCMDCPKLLTGPVTKTTLEIQARK